MIIFGLKVMFCLVHPVLLGCLFGKLVSDRCVGVDLQSSGWWVFIFMSSNFQESRSSYFRNIYSRRQQWFEIHFPSVKSLNLSPLLCSLNAQILLSKLTWGAHLNHCLHNFLLIMTPPLDLQMFWNILIEQKSLQTKLLLTEYWDVKGFTFIHVCLFERVLIDSHLFFSSGVQVFL